MGPAEGRPGRYVRVVLRDSGTSITPEARQWLFEPFFSTKPAGKGIGLGMAQVYGFVKQSRGKITGDSAEGEGTSIVLYLPSVEGRP